MEDTALGPDEPVQIFRPMVGHGLHEDGDGGEEGLHVERGVERHHIRNQAEKTFSFQMMEEDEHRQSKPQNVTIFLWSLINSRKWALLKTTYILKSELHSYMESRA